MPDETVDQTVQDTVPPTDAAAPETPADDGLGDVKGFLDDDTDDGGETAAEEVDAADEPAGDDEGAGEVVDEVAGESDAEAADEVEQAAAAAPATPANPAIAKAAQDAENAQRVQDAQQEQAHRERVATFKKDLAAHKALVAAGKFDPFEHGAEGERLKLEHIELQEIEMGQLRQKSAAFEQQQAEQSFWDQWGRKNPDIGAKVGRQILAEEYDRLSKKYPKATHDSLMLAAEDRWENRINVRRGQMRAKGGDKLRAATPALAKPGAPKAPVKPVAKAAPKPAGGGRVIPKGATAARGGVPKTPEESLVAELSQGGGVRGFLDD